MSKNIFIIIMGLIILFSLWGCGSSTQIELSKTFQDELDGLKTIEQDVNKGDFDNAEIVADRLDDEFNDIILPQLMEKKDESYIEDISDKWDDLQEALVEEENAVKIIDLIKVNRDNFNRVAMVLGVSI